MRRRFLQFLAESGTKDGFGGGGDSHADHEKSAEDAARKSVEDPEDTGEFLAGLNQKIYDSLPDFVKNSLGPAAGSNAQAKMALGVALAGKGLASLGGLASPSKSLKAGAQTLAAWASPDVNFDGIRGYIHGAGAAQVNLQNWNRGLQATSDPESFWRTHQAQFQNIPANRSQSPKTVSTAKP